MKKSRVLALFLTTVLSFTACTSGGGGETTTVTQNQGVKETQAAQTSGDKKVIKLGINGEETVIWKGIKEELAKENISLELVSFADYIVPNTALVDGEIDANAFQTEIFFKKFLEESKADLSVLGYTVLAPMAIYPSKAKTLEEIPEGGKIAIPNDVSNGGRALVLLDDAGVIKVDPSKGVLPTVKDIIENPKNVQIIELQASQIPAAKDEFDVAVINNGVAKEFGLTPVNDSIYMESTEKDYIKNYYNIIAVQTKDLEKPELKRLIALYQTEKTKEWIKEEYKGSAIPAFE